MIQDYKFKFFASIHDTNLLNLSIIVGCCQSIKLESGGGADFYQHELLGSYGQVGMSHGKPAYGQINGRYYLYWLPIGVWTVTILRIFIFLPYSFMNN